MAKLHVERIGGLAAFGAPRSRIRSHGEVDTAALSPADQRAVEGLFQSHGKAPPTQARDTFRYRISRVTPDGVETIEAPEDAVPAALSQCVKDELV
jgi:hypothetical protein